MNRRTRGRRAPCEGCIFNLTDGIFKTSFCLFFPRVPRILRLAQLRFPSQNGSITLASAWARRGANCQTGLATEA